MLASDPNDSPVTIILTGLLVHKMRNNIGFPNKNTNMGGVDTAFNSWDLALTPAAADFASITDTGALGPRQPDGSLPNIDFMKLPKGSKMIDKGTDVGLAFADAAPDLGAFEYGATSASNAGAGGAGTGAGSAGASGTSPTGGAEPSGSAGASGVIGAGDSGTNNAGGSQAGAGAPANAGSTAELGGSSNPTEMPSRDGNSSSGWLQRSRQIFSPPQAASALAALLGALALLRQRCRTRIVSAESANR
ncbi:MAG: hypothetical protein WDO69_35085 [Pseudomonadota bacterium]